VSLLTIPEYDFSTESDVEQKFIMPLLTHPSFLEIPSRAVLTKKSMRALPFVEKSALPKGYIPDYIVFFNGHPILVIEAKPPEVAIKQALDEARMYGQVLNQNFPTKINPVAFVMGCNGREIAVGPTDANDQKLFSVTDVVIGSDALAQLKELIDAAALSRIAQRIKSSLTARSYTTPASRLPVQLFLDRVRPNALAPYLAPLYEMFFRAEDPEKIQLILDQAYVDTAELREYDLVLHSMLRHIERSYDYRTIQTDRHREYTLTPEIDRYDEGGAISGGRLHLIIGSRGAGKSLFIYRFFTHLMPKELKNRAAWCIIDFNHAPSSIDNIETYICERFVEECQNLQFDPYSLEGLNRVFAVQINQLQRGPLSVITDEAEKQRALSTELLHLSADKRKFGIQLARALTSNAVRPLIVAFDNVDRRESAQQLQIFQAAQWFRRETHAFMLLTLRDVTFERYKDQPPLDAFAQISNFYIRPPRFALVLQKRLRSPYRLVCRKSPR
jgi:Type I restriction enzyme R protein N terminus (HSDR_N)